MPCMGCEYHKQQPLKSVYFYLILTLNTVGFNLIFYFPALPLEGYCYLLRDYMTKKSDLLKEWISLFYF